MAEVTKTYPARGEFTIDLSYMDSKDTEEAEGIIQSVDSHVLKYLKSELIDSGLNCSSKVDLKKNLITISVNGQVVYSFEFEDDDSAGNVPIEGVQVQDVANILCEALKNYKQDVTFYNGKHSFKMDPEFFVKIVDEGGFPDMSKVFDDLSVAMSEYRVDYAEYKSNESKKRQIVGSLLEGNSLNSIFEGDFWEVQPEEVYQPDGYDRYVEEFEVWKKQAKDVITDLGKSYSKLIDLMNSDFGSGLQHVKGCPIKGDLLKSRLPFTEWCGLMKKYVDRIDPFDI